MTDTTCTSASKNTGPKPKLSLLSSKQSCTRLRPESFASDYAGPQTSSLDAIEAQTNGFSSKIVSEEQLSRVDNYKSTGELKQAMSDNGTLGPRTNDTLEDDRTASLSSGSRDQHSSGLDKLSVSKEDLLGLLSMLKSENQSKDIALASIKLEQLKRLINPVEISRSSLAKTYMQLQDQLRAKDQLKNGNIPKNLSKPRQTSSTTSGAFEETQDDKEKKNLDKDQVTSFDQSLNDDESDQESIGILNALLELLDRHPLLALPRDSIYCLDYNCNELSTKNYLNLKIQHLENLIDQHRRFRYHIGERLKQSEQRYMDLTLKLEYERNQRLEKEKSTYKNSGKTILLKHIDKLKDALEKEKVSKHAIVMTLLNELLDQRESNEILLNKVIDLEKRLSDSGRPQQRTSPTTSQSSACMPIVPACKPMVPAKPAQLLDRQRSQTKNK